MSNLIEPGVYTCWLPAMGHKVVRFEISGSITIPESWEPRYDRNDPHHRVNGQPKYKISHYVTPQGDIVSLNVALNVDSGKNFPENLVISSKVFSILAGEDQMETVGAQLNELEEANFIEAKR